MKARHARWLGLIACATAAFALAQTPSAREYEPYEGQEGKDVVWVPSPQLLVDKMLDMAKVAPGDFLMDLGSGDGRTVISAAKRGVRALGIEYNPDMVALSRRNAAKARVGEKAQFRRADIFETDLSKATVITLFLLPDLNLKLRPTILSLKPGTRVVSNSFDMGEWDPDEVAALGCATFCTARLWIVPARVEGRWKTAQGDLTIKQNFQKIDGTLASGSANISISEGKLRGDGIRFLAGGAEYRARVLGQAMEGTVKFNGKTTAWKATR